jgi:alkanesulfonate monooxygenase
MSSSSVIGQPHTRGGPDVGSQPQAARVSPAATPTAFSADLRVFTTTPPSSVENHGSYLERVIETARWSEAAGCEGTLIYTDNSLVDPWLVAQAIIANTKRLCPLIALQPVYMHPYTAAKLVASLGFLHGRRVWLNMVAGGFKNDLTSLGDHTPHDDRYDRAVEYALLVLRLLDGEVVTLSGTYYRVKNLKMSLALPSHLRPGLLMSGSSPAGFAAAQALGAIPVKYPRPPGEEDGGPSSSFGVRIGIIARETDDEAWRIAHERFPEDRKGQIAHALAMSGSDSSWHRQLSAKTSPNSEAAVGAERRNPYWLLPFQNYKTFCPYLVGAYDVVARLVRGYLGLGARTFILDVPPTGDELRHAAIVLRAARNLAA